MIHHKIKDKKFKKSEDTLAFTIAFILLFVLDAGSALPSA